MATMARINPRVDIAFKKIFGVEENKDLLISLINSIVDEEDKVAEVTLLNPYNPKNFRGDKLSILDIKAKSETGKKYNIEIQITDDADYDKRALYYWAKLYTEQLKEGEDYSGLFKAIGIHILHFISIPHVDKYHNVFHVKERETGQHYFKDLELHTIELKKFSDSSVDKPSDLPAKIKNSLDMWIAFLTRHDLLDKKHLPAQLDQPVLKKALNVLDRMDFSADEREAYEDHLKWLRMESGTLRKYEEKGHLKGLKEGMTKGMAKGRTEGLKEGIAKGRTEGLEEGIAKGRTAGLEEGIAKGRTAGLEEGNKQALRTVAQKMLSNGLSIEDVVQLIGLKRDEFDNLMVQAPD